MINAKPPQTRQQEETADRVVKEFQRLSGNRMNWESHWEEIAERMIPSHSSLFQSFGQLRSQGNKRTEQIFDSTAVIAVNRFGSILDSLLTPRSQTWSRLTCSNPHLKKNRQVALYFEEANRLLFKFRYAPKANFASQNQQNYISLGAYGTGCVFIDELKDRGQKGIRYRNLHLGEIYFVENHQGIVDRALRHFMLTARQAIQMFGEKVPDLIRGAVETNPDQPFFFLHFVEPREDIIEGRVDAKNFPYASFYVSVTGKELISEGGYRTFPYAISRYQQAPGEVYGRSPAMDVLPAVKTLNEEKKTMLKQGHRAVDPVLLAHDDGIIDGFSMKPGAMNAGGVSADGRPLVHALPVGNLAIGKELMDDERSIINDSFLISIFQVLTESPEMTATEVLERTREKGILLAPTIGRQQSEYLGPMIERELDILESIGVLPPMPQILLEARGEYHIEYDSPLSRAMRAEEASGLMRAVESTLQVVNVTQDKSPLDWYNWDEIVPDLSRIQGVPERWMRDPAVVAAVRQSRAMEQQQQAQIQAAPAAAAMVKAGAVAQKAAAG